MHTKILHSLSLFFFHFALSFFVPMAGTPNSLSSPTPKRPCFTNADLEGSPVSHPFPLFMPFLFLRSVAVCLLLASLFPQILMCIRKVQELMRQNTSCPRREGRPVRGFSCGQERYGEGSSHLVTPGFQIALNALP